MGRAVTMSPGFVWRSTLRGVLIHPRDSPPFTIDRRALPVLAALDRAWPDPAAESQLVAAMGWTGRTRPPNAEQWMGELLGLFETVGLIGFSVPTPIDAADPGAQ